MTKTASINIRIDPLIKTSAEKLYESFGMTLSEAINIFLHVSVMEGGLPFALKQTRYNMETEKAMQEARAISQGTVAAKTYKSAAELFSELDKEDEQC